MLGGRDISRKEQVVTSELIFEFVELMDEISTAASNDTTPLSV